jgi:hypothetical protein
MEVRELRHARGASLALRGQAIQLKRLHNFSTAARRASAPPAVRRTWCALGTLCALGALGAVGAFGMTACAGQSAPSGPQTGDFSLSAAVDAIQLSPGDATTVGFVVSSRGVPAAGQTVGFAIVQGPGASPQGATLAATSAVSDASGMVTVGVRAGLTTTFQVQASLGASSAQIAVIVETGTTGSVLVAPFFAPSSTAATTATGLTVRFYDQTSCGALNLAHLPTPARDVANLALGGTALYDFVNTGTVSVAVGQALNMTGTATTVLAQGCVDIPGSSLLADSTVQVALPLYDATPNPVGTFAVTSTLSFQPPLAAAAALAAPWAALSDCPLDPAQLWLDCTIDALSGSSSNDPLDCSPSIFPGGEGALGDALTAQRGLPLLDDSGAATNCRGAKAGSGAESLDAITLGLFGSPTPPALLALPAVAADAAALLDGVTLQSVLTIEPSETAGEYLVTHTLSTAMFGPAAGAGTVTLAALGLPILTATTTASDSDGLLTIGNQGFTLRLGTAARAAFGPLSLVPRGLPATAAALVPALFALASSADGTASGCAALDAVLCPSVSEPVGCLLTACAAGLSALAAKLDGAFDGADGPGLDLTLSGSAPLFDTHGDGMASVLGSTGINPTQVGLWSVDLRTALGRVEATASLNGVRSR